MNFLWTNNFCGNIRARAGSLNNRSSWFHATFSEKLRWENLARERKRERKKERERKSECEKKFDVHTHSKCKYEKGNLNFIERNICDRPHDSRSSCLTPGLLTHAIKKRTTTFDIG